MNANLSIAIQTINVPEGTLEERLEAAMQQTVNGHWMLSTDDECFRAAIGAVLLGANAEEQERIKSDLVALDSVVALLRGIPVDIERVPVPENPLGLGGMWQRIKEES